MKPAPNGRRLIVALAHPILLLAALRLLFWLTAFQVGIQTADDPDIWWVAAAGRDMLSSGHVPATNQYAVTDAARPWVMHEWLLAVPYDLGLERYGPAFFALVALLFTTLGFAAILGVTLARSPSFPAAVVLSLYALSFLSLRLTYARPISASLVFTVAMAALAFAPRFTRGRAFGAIALELVWANTHGSFPLGVALLFASALETRQDRSRRLFVGALAALATLVNPYGLRLHGLFWSYLTGDRGIYAFIYGHIVEYGPAWGSSEFVRTRFFWGFLGVWLLPLAALCSPAWRYRALLSLCFLGYGLLHFRHTEVSGLTTLILLTPFFGELFTKWGIPNRAPSSRARFVAAVIFPGVVIGILGHVLMLPRRTDAEWTGRYAPVYRLAPQIPDDAKVYTAFGRAGLVIWLTAPRGVRVLYDSRNDCYSPQVARDAIELNSGTPSAGTVLWVLDKYRIDHVLMPADHVVGGAVAASPRWRALARDEDWILFARRSPLCARSPPFC
jgi:hypothetical protein